MINGILLVDKEKDMTSRDVVNIISRKFKTKKVGHLGTLDPLATGLLVITINDATKTADLLVNDTKEYLVEVKLGISTDTYDITGNILKKSDYNLTKEDIEKTLLYFKKNYMQEVPIYSAVKVNGKKLYQYAREGIAVTLPKKEVTIHNVELIDFKEDIFVFKTLVSKGTYIRSLINDISNYLNIPMTMNNLRRISSGKFSIASSYKLIDIENDNYNIIPLKEYLDIKTIAVDYNLYQKIKNGAILENKEDDIIMYTYNDVVIGIYKRYTKDTIKPMHIFKK